MKGPGKGVGAEEERGALQAKPIGKGLQRRSPSSALLPLQICPSFTIYSPLLGRLNSSLRSEFRLQLQGTLPAP